MSENKDVIFASIQVHGRPDSVCRPQGLSPSEESLPSGMALVSWMESGQERAWGGPARRRHREGALAGLLQVLLYGSLAACPGWALLNTGPGFFPLTLTFSSITKGNDFRGMWKLD